MIDMRKIRTAAALAAALCLGIAQAQAQARPDSRGADSAPELMFRVDGELSTAAVSAVSGQQMFKTPTTNITNTLYGLAPGLSVQQGSGDPGGNTAWMKIRGIGTFRSEDNFTVFVDGFQTDMSYAQRLLPTEIANVYVLKDGAALSMFGMKGSNGVLWIETNRGRIGRTKIDVNFRQGFQRPLAITKPLGSADYAAYYNEAVSNDGGRVWNPKYTAAQIADYREGRGVDTDWYDEVLRSSASPFTSADVSVSGGGDNIRYFSSVGYMRNLGAIDNKRDADDHVANSTYQQFSIRTNLDVSFLKIFEVRIDLGGYLADRIGPNYSLSSLFGDLERYPNNIYAPFDSPDPTPDGNRMWSGTATHPNNPLASVKGIGTESSRDRSIQANFTLRQNFDFLLPGLYLQESASFANWIRGGRWISREYTRWSDGVEQTSQRDTPYGIGDDYGTNQWGWNQFRVQAGYENSFGPSRISSAVKYEQWGRQVDSNQNSYDSGSIQMNYAFQNVAGRLHYSYDRRYAAEFGFAYSGSDNYLKGNRFSFYPSLSGAWIASNEDFLAGSPSVELLKLRASWGQTGYDYSSYGRYLYGDTWGWSGSYPVGGMTGDPTWISALTPLYMSNPDITSERSNKFNVGIDARLFGSLEITVDAYMENRKGIVVRDNSYSSGVGLTPPYTNAGEVASRGLEFDVRYSKRIGSVDISVGGTGSFVSDRIVVSGEIPSASPDADPVGRKIWAHFGYEAVGFYEESDFDAGGNLAAGIAIPNFGEIQPGDVRYRDINGDGYINERDRTAIGKRDYPDLYYSFHGQVAFKGFDFSFLFQGMAGRDVNLLSARNKFVAFENYSTVYANAAQSWAYYPDEGIDRRSGALFPRLSLESNSNNYQNSSLWIRRGDFLKLRNVEIGYSLPQKVVGKIGLDRLRVYVNGVNLLTFSKLYRDYNVDPERMTGYPAVKSVNVGVSVGF